LLLVIFLQPQLEGAKMSDSGEKNSFWKTRADSWLIVFLVWCIFWIVRDNREMTDNITKKLNLREENYPVFSYDSSSSHWRVSAKNDSTNCFYFLGTRDSCSESFMRLMKENCYKQF
jgi:hypothetical protein